MGNSADAGSGEPDRRNSPCLYNASGWWRAQALSVSAGPWFRVLFPVGSFQAQTMSATAHRAFPALAIVVVIAGMALDAQTSQPGPRRAFGPGRCGPVDASYVRVANETGGQVLPLGPSEVAGAAPLMSATFAAETIVWSTGPFTANGRTFSVPIDDLSSRVSFTLSTDTAITDLVITNPTGAAVGAGAPGVEGFIFGCVRNIIVERPASGTWSVRVSGAGTFWLVVQARSDLSLDDAEFVRVVGRPGHEGLFKIPGQPVAGRPATLRARITRDGIADATFDLVSMIGEPLQSLDLSPATGSSTEDEYVGDMTRLPMVPFRVRAAGRDRNGAPYQRVSRAAFHAATVEVIPPEGVELNRRQRTAVTVGIHNVGAPTRLQIRAVIGATVLTVAPAVLRLGTNERREVVIQLGAPQSVTSSSGPIIVTAESADDPLARNSAIIESTDAPR
jgi:von Willebrand factor A domain-containing protein 7